MTEKDNPALKFELLQSDDFAQYLLRDSVEIEQVLRNLIRRRAMVTAYINGSRDFMLTTVLEVDHGRLLLDMPADTSQQRRAENAEALICITQLDSVKIQFPLAGVDRIEHDGRPALVADIPDRLLRLQRREYFRLTAPVSHSLVCQIPVPGESGPPSTYEARVLDISGGGVAIVVPPEGIEFKPDTEFTSCQIQLPETGTITAKLRIRSVFRVTNRNGISMLRAGCEFVDLSDKVASLIHKYILKVERERSARERGL
ncbi:flagellar brake protein [Nitrogeniibacter mangrovi]|uniref:Flagellar brake protein YcgR n=1 Tax=Nitrogeniibacter mangrovi TaxID=2016596 RepID=A0A6C1B166_9RHOO|nr:flagellar brake protein [Nitrogeniibacter mangrovi]QID17317.1 flagellar brake protein [Nitrogeniibacter mangrovi]